MINSLKTYVDIGGITIMAKNKMKSHRGAMKRMKLTGSGKLRETRHTRATSLPRKALREKEGYVNQLHLQVQILREC